MRRDRRDISGAFASRRSEVYQGQVQQREAHSPLELHTLTWKKYNFRRGHRECRLRPVNAER